MQSLTNNTGLNLPFAVWLAADDYDFRSNGAKAISATSLLKPVRQILLWERLTPENSQTPDVSDRIAARVGHAFHDSMEKAWVSNYRQALTALGYPTSVIDRVRINPTNEELRASNNIIPVYLEQRGSREIMGYKISGKFDLVMEGELNDTKSTSVYTYIKGGKDEDYKLQGSIYRWIHQDKITSDHITINFIFTDWQRSMAKANDAYPQQRVLSHRVELMSLSQTEHWIRQRIKELEASADLPEDRIPLCSDKDLWRSEPVFKYYANPDKTDGRATKNNETMAEALAYKASKGGKGVIIEHPGKVKACGYCPAFPICSQKDLYEHD